MIGSSPGQRKEFGIELDPDDNIEGTAEIYHRISMKTYRRLVAFMNKRRYDSRNKAANDLIEVGLIVEENVDKLKDPEIVAEIKAQLREGGLVDYIQHLNPKDLEILCSIVDTEQKARGIRRK